MPALSRVSLRPRGGRDRGGFIERRYFLNVSPPDAWAALHHEANAAALYPELTLGPAEPAWPAAGATRLARLRLGLLREPVLLESLEARPGAVFRVRFVGADVRGEFGWYLGPVFGGTRVVHEASLAPAGRWARWLAALGGRSLGERIEEHLRALKVAAEG